MSGISLVASIEKRLDALIELSRRSQGMHAASGKALARPSVTISREFGCEGFPVAEKTQALLQGKTVATWGLMDRDTLDKVASSRELSDEILKNLGEKNRFLDDMMSTIFTHWTSDKDYYQLLCDQIVTFAKGGNVIIVGVGAGILTQNMPNCHNFRIIAPMEFKIKSVSRRHHITEEEAERLIVKKQKQRDAFIKDFLNKDVADVSLYDVIFNNAKNSADQIADMICYHVLSGGKNRGA
jgi:cytidylate kinase